MFAQTPLVNGVFTEINSFCKRVMSDTRRVGGELIYYDPPPFSRLSGSLTWQASCHSRALRTLRCAEQSKVLARCCSPTACGRRPRRCPAPTLSVTRHPPYPQCNMVSVYAASGYPQRVGSHGAPGRGLPSSTFRLNVGAFCGIGGACRGCLGGVMGMLWGIRGCLGCQKRLRLS